MIKGAPFVPSRKKNVDSMVKFADPEIGDNGVLSLIDATNATALPGIDTNVPSPNKNSPDSISQVR